jgi:hypothetical protein
MSDIQDRGPRVETPVGAPAEPLQHTVERRTWEEFRESGVFWAMNTILHWFGWAIVVVTDDAQPEKVLDAYPIRTKWRCFPPDSNERGIQRLTEWMASAGPALREDIKD